MWTPGRMAAAAKIKTLREAGFSNADIIEAKREGLIEAYLEAK